MSKTNRPKVEWRNGRAVEVGTVANADPATGALTVDPDSVTDAGPGEGRRTPRRGRLLAENGQTPNAHSVGFRLHCEGEPTHVLCTTWVANPPWPAEHDGVYLGPNRSQPDSRQGWERESRGKGGKQQLLLRCEVCGTSHLVNLSRLEEFLRAAAKHFDSGTGTMIATTWQALTSQAGGSS